MTDDRAKTKRPPQFRGALNEPIYAPFDVPAADGELILGDGFYHVFEARLKKMSALAKHYKVEIPPDGLALAYALACDFVPGFQVRYDDPTARALGLPEADYGKGTKPKGAGAIPEVFGGTMLIEVFRWFQKTFPGESEAELADRIVP